MSTTEEGHSDMKSGARSDPVGSGGGAATASPGRPADTPAAEDDSRGSVIRPRGNTDPGLREACAVDLDGARPSDARAARVWLAGREKREIDQRREKAQAKLDAAWVDYVAAIRTDRDARHLDVARRLAARGFDLDTLLRLAEAGELPQAAARK